MLWDDHVGGTGNVTLGEAGTSTSTGDKYTSTWYSFNASFPASFLGLDAAAGVTSLRFVVNDKVEDQGGLGFAVQDGVMFSTTSCVSQDKTTARFDVAVRVPTIVYLH